MLNESTYKVCETLEPIKHLIILHATAAINVYTHI